MPQPFPNLDNARQEAIKAANFAREAINAADRCQGGKALRLSKDAARHIAAARAAIRAAPAAERNAAPNYLRALDQVISRAEGFVAAVKPALDRCQKLPAVYGVALKAGTFGKAQDFQSKPPSDHPNQVKFTFTLGPKSQCERLGFVAVYYIENDATLETLPKPSQGDNRTAHKGALEGFPPNGKPPRDADAADGYVVDAPPDGDSPFWPDTSRKGDTITVSDRPSFVARGHTAYFETCVVCLDDPTKILGCYRWRHTAEYPKPPAEILEGPVPPTRPFQKALQKWLDNRK